MKTLILIFILLLSISSCKNKEESNLTTEKSKITQIDSNVLSILRKNFNDILLKDLNVSTELAVDSNKIHRGIKSITGTSYEFKFGKQESIGKVEFIKKYNKAGKIEDVINFLNKNYNKTQFFYNEKGNLIKCNIFNKTSDLLINNTFNIIAKIEFEFNDLNNLARLKMDKNDDNYLDEFKDLHRKILGLTFNKNNDDLINILSDSEIDILSLKLKNFEKTFQYNVNQKINEIKVWKEDGSLEAKVLINYDTLNKIKEIISYQILKGEYVKEEKKRDLYKNSVATFKLDTLINTVFNPDGSIIYEEIYKIDKSNISINKFTKLNGNEVEGNGNKLKSFNKNGNIIRDRWTNRIEKNYIYNESNMLTESVFYKYNNSLDTIIIKSKYNEKGNVIEETEFNLKNEMHNKFVFNYDEKNNNFETIEYDSLNNQ